MSELLAAALAYAARGRCVFFLSGSKRPVKNCPDCPPAGPDHSGDTCRCLTCHGFYAASRDPVRIRAMHAAVPGGLLAVRTGAASGIVVVDIDPRNGGQVDPVSMPPTRYLWTGSNPPGLHLVYRHPGVAVPISASRLGPGIDVRADGGYAVVPPSRHPRTGRPYRWADDGREVAEMPRALVAACLPPAPISTAAVTTSARATTTRAAGDIFDPDKLLAAHLEALRRAPEGRRRTTLYGVARGVARMVSAGALSAGDAWSLLSTEGRAAGQTDRDTRAAIEGGFSAEGLVMR